MRPFTLAGLLALALASLVGPVYAQEPGVSSLTAWLDRFATRLEQVTGGSQDGLRLELHAGRGADDRRVERVIAPHLARRLREGGVVGAVGHTGALRVEVVVSLEADRVWAIATLSGDSLTAPLAVAQDWPVDRELEALLGLQAPRPGQGRWSMERLGTLPEGVLDVLLHDLDGDGSDDLTVLGVDGVRTYLWSTLAARPVLDQGPISLPGDRAWERAPLGWIAWDGSAVRIATTRTPALALREGVLVPADEDAVPLRQPWDPSRAPLLLGRRAPHQPTVRVDALPGGREVRDAVQWPGRDDTWLWVDTAGVLGGVGPGGPARFEEIRVGDRLVLGELDGASGPELVTTRASLPGDSDHVRVHAVSPSFESLPVLFEGQFEGSVAAMAVGDIDFDGLGDLLVVEETSGAPVLWIIRRRS